MWKVQGLLLFWRIWTVRCFPWDSVSKSTHWHLPEKGKMESALSSSFPSSSANGSPQSLLPPNFWVHNSSGLTPLVSAPQVSGGEGRKVKLFVRLVVLLLLGWWSCFSETFIHLVFKYLLWCFFFFPPFWRVREKQTFQCSLSRIFPLLYNWVGARQF